jgi:RNA polymerase sigma-70 factor (ECF subfamily)
VSPEEFRNLALVEMEAVYRLAYHLARQPQEADDFVQETYLRAFKSADSYRPHEHGVRPWLFKILHNVVNTRLSQQLRQRDVLDDLQHQPPAATPTGPAGVPDLSQVNWDRVDERLKAAVHELPLPHRTAFLLCAVEGMTYREIADVTEVPIGTVMSRLYRARATLAERLVSLAAEQGLNRETKRQ